VSEFRLIEYDYFLIEDFKALPTPITYRRYKQQEHKEPQQQDTLDKVFRSQRQTGQTEGLFTF
jgi:hypothetical protein